MKGSLFFHLLDRRDLISSLLNTQLSSSQYFLDRELSIITFSLEFRVNVVSKLISFHIFV